MSGRRVRRDPGGVPGSGHRRRHPPPRPRAPRLDGGRGHGPRPADRRTDGESPEGRSSVLASSRRSSSWRRSVSARAETPGTAGDADLPHGSRDVDRAALLGTALAAVVALSFSGQGEWDWLGATAGIALLVVLGAFFRLPAGRQALAPRLRGELAAVAVVAALAATLVIAPVLQAVLAATTDAGRTCRASAAVAAGAPPSEGTQKRGAELAVSSGDAGVATATDALSRAAEDERRTVMGDCIGEAPSRWLWAPAAGMAALGYTCAWWLVRRRHARATRGEAA